MIRRKCVEACTVSQVHVVVFIPEVMVVKFAKWFLMCVLLSVQIFGDDSNKRRLS
jgi:hypothetical protein